MENEITVVTEETAIVKFKENTLDVYLKSVEEDALNFVGDVSTEPGRKKIISKAASVTKIKTTIDKARKKLTESERVFINKVNAEGKKSFDFLTELSQKVRQPVTDYENEKKRIEQERREKAELELAWDEAIVENELWKREQEIKRKEAEEKAKEDARIAREEVEAQEKAQREYEERVQREAKEKAERDAKKEKQDQKIKRIEDLGLIFNGQEWIKEDINIAYVDLLTWSDEEFNVSINKIKTEIDRRAKTEAEERAKLKAERVEREKKEALERAEREKQEAINQAKLKQAREIAEKQRLERVAAEEKKATEEKKARHHAHQKKFNREALEDFKKNGFEEETAIRIITLIAKKEISHISMNY